MSDYERLVAQETLIVEATEAICEAMEPDQQDDSGKVTRKELAQRLGCGKSHVTQLLSGERNLTLRSLADMAGALGRKVTLTLEPIPADPGEKSATEDNPKDCGGSGAVELLAERLYRFAALQQGWEKRWPEASEPTKNSWREDARSHLAAIQPLLAAPEYPVGEKGGEDYCGCGHPQSDHGGIMETERCQSCPCEGFDSDQLVTDQRSER